MSSISAKIEQEKTTAVAPAAASLTSTQAAKSVVDSTTPTKQTRPPTTTEDEDTIEILDDELDNQLHFDMDALNLGFQPAQKTAPKQIGENSTAAMQSSSSTSASSTTPANTKPTQRFSGKRINVEEEYERREKTKERLNLVIVGMPQAA